MACSLGGAWVTWPSPELGFYPPTDADASPGTHGCFCPPDPGAFQQSKMRRVWTWGQEPRVQALTLTFNSGCDRRKVTSPFCIFTSFVEWISHPWEPAGGKGLGREQWVASSASKDRLLVTVWPGLWVTGDLRPPPLTPCLKLGHTSRPLLKLFLLPE